MIDKNKLYDKGQDAGALDAAGGYFLRHMLAMTAEDLHGKADIAKELGSRDKHIDQLMAKNTVLQARVQELEGMVPKERHRRLLLNAVRAYYMASAVYNPDDPYGNIDFLENCEECMQWLEVAFDLKPEAPRRD